MSQLACFGGKPVEENLASPGALTRRQDLERKYLLEAYDSGTWDDWPGTDSLAERFERAWAKFVGTDYCALVTNGTHSLQLALEALDVGVGDEVIVPGLTWQATASVVCDVNAVPVLVDVEPDTLCLDPVAAASAITPKTRAIIPVHLYHRMADMTALLRLAEEHELAIIEDAAHAHGSRWQARGAGAIGAFGSFSFQRSKLMNAGEGGALVTNDETLYWRIVSQRSCGRPFGESVRVHSGNYRITSLQAGILLGQLAALEANAEHLDRNGLALDAAIAEAPGVTPLRRHPAITRQCSYGFAFLFDREAFDGLDARVFRQALGAELGVAFYEVYEPLNQSPVYFPHTKKRHRLNDAYTRAITPDRWELPVAESLWRHRAVQAHWPILECPPERADRLTQAVAKVYEARHTLLERGAELL